MAKKNLRAFDVEFGAVGFGEHTASVSISIGRGNFATLDEAFGLLGKAQLKVEFEGDTPLLKKTFKATCETATMKVAVDTIGVRMSVPINAIDRAQWSELAKVHGRVRVERVGDAGSDEDDPGDGE